MKAIQVIAVLALSALTASAQIVMGWSGGNKVSIGPGTAGLEFTVGATPESVSALGVYATGPSGALFDSHAVGIWDTTSRTLLASALVTPAGSFAIDSTWYVNLAAPLTLPPGIYVLAAQYPDITFDQVVANATSIVTAPGITIGDAVLSTGTAFDFPDLVVSGADGGFFGPNALMTPVPEPAQAGIVVGFALVLLAVGGRIGILHRPGIRR